MRISAPGRCLNTMMIPAPSLRRPSPPLRELRYEGVIDDLEEITCASEGEVYVFAVEILGAINYHPREDAEPET
jgi:hypothetical protein